MKLLIVVLLALLTIPVTAIRPLDWSHEARICGNIQTDESGILRAKMRVIREGCLDVHVVPVAGGDAFLVYGTKVVRTVEY
jgi:hypothetical protein